MSKYVVTLHASVEVDGVDSAADALRAVSPHDIVTLADTLELYAENVD